MLRSICSLTLLLTAASAAVAGALPVEPVASPVATAEITSRDRGAPPRDKWLRVGLIWGATALDLASTRHALASNPATRESNPLFATSNGGFRTGAYLGISLPLDMLASYANLKYPHSRTIRILTYVTTFAKCGIAIGNFRQAK
jgi:hypothetical protein